MANFRTLYSGSALSVRPSGSSVWTPIHGVQSASVETSFNLDNVFQWSELEIFEQVEQVPNVTVNVTRVLCGYPLMYTLATANASASTLIARTREVCDLAISIYADDYTVAAGVPLTTMLCSGMYVNSLSYALPVNGNSTETIGFIGNDKRNFATNQGVSVTSGVFADDAPIGHVILRQNVIMGSVSSGSIWPTDIPGISSSGYNDQGADGQFAAHIQDVNITANLGREDLLELGRRKPYYKYATFPVQVSTTIGLTPGGLTPDDNVEADSEATNLTNQTISIRLTDGTVFDLGSKNKLSGVTYTGASAGQTQPASVQYSYQNFNVLTVTSP